MKDLRMFASFAARYLHVSRSSFAPVKSQLAALRKKTGYTFSNCKKALELNNNDIILAEKWLQEQAQALGWSKATKLEGRQTTQGLIGVAMHNNSAAIVEVNCETDFVARNEKFQAMVSTAAFACLQFALKQPNSNYALTKINMDSEQLRQIPAEDGKLLTDHLALMIGNLGENASLRRALCLKANSNQIQLSSYVHPQTVISQDDAMPATIEVGRFGALVALKQNCAPTENSPTVIRELCQHIVGMKPLRLGDATVDKATENADDETCLIYQEFLLDNSVTVNDVLLENNIEIVDFKRFECGESLVEKESDDLPRMQDSGCT